MFAALALHPSQDELAGCLVTLPHQEVSVLPEQLLRLQPGDGAVVPLLSTQQRPGRGGGDGGEAAAGRVD